MCQIKQKKWKYQIWTAIQYCSNITMIDYLIFLVNNLINLIKNNKIKLTRFSFYLLGCGFMGQWWGKVNKNCKRLSSKQLQCDQLYY